MKKLNYVPWGLAIILIVIQFFQIDTTNPAYDQSNDLIQIEKPAENISALLKGACYDCHSNETKYPWYTKVVPLGHWIKGHVKHAREQLNFSEWANLPADRRRHKLEECAEEVAEAHMPLKSYTWLHAEAKLTDKDRTVLVDWFKSRMDQ